MILDNDRFWDDYVSLCNKHRRYAAIENGDIKELKDNEEIHARYGRLGAIKGICLTRTVVDVFEITRPSDQASTVLVPYWRNGTFELRTEEKPFSELLQEGDNEQ